MLLAAAAAAAVAAGRVCTLDDRVGEGWDGWSECDRIDLDWAGIGNDAVEALSAAVAGSSTLKEVSLRRNGIGEEGAAAVGAALAITGIRQLDLSHNDIGARGLRRLLRGVGAEHSLRALKLWMNGVGDQGADAVATLFRRGAELRELELGGQGITAAGARSLGEALGHVCTSTGRSVQVLNLWDNEIGDDGMRVLAGNLHKCDQLRVLNVGDNSLTAAAANDVSALLRDSDLDVFSAWSNDLGDDTAVKIADILPSSRRLSSLGLGKNGVSDAGAVALATALSAAPSVRELQLNSNSIGDAGAKALADRVCSLRSLQLRHNSVTEEGAIALEKAALDCAQPPRIELFGNLCFESTADRIFGMNKNQNEEHSTEL